MINQDEPGRERTSKTAGDLEQEITLILRHLPIPLTITKRDVNRYAWQWLEEKGEGDSFPDALENALTYMETAYTVASQY